MGEGDSSVWVGALAARGARVERLGQPIVSAHDASDASACGAPASGATLTLIGELRRSSDPAYIALADVTYVTADRNAACRAHGRVARETRGVVRFREAGATVRAVTPMRFAPAE